MRVDDIGDRIKRYEAVFNYKLTPRTPLFIRIDGRAFHTFTKGLNRPFDETLIDVMIDTAIKTARELSGFKLAYAQSDEVTFMLSDYTKLNTQGWFGYELNKLVSLSASIYTAYFNEFWRIRMGNNAKLATFDSRAFSVPVDDAPNVFIWRQRDWERNSLQMYARAHFAHSELNNKNTEQIKAMLENKGANWDNLAAHLKNGVFIRKDYTTSRTKKDYDKIAEMIDGRF